MRAETAIDRGNVGTVVSDALTSTSAGGVHPMAFVYAANYHHHHHHHRDGEGARNHHAHPATRRRMCEEDEGALASVVGVGGVVDPSAYERVTSGNPFGGELLATPAAAAANARARAHSRVLLPTTDAAVYVNAKQYNAILRRRKARAKEAAKAVGRLTVREASGRGVAKYASRSAHAKKRVRGKDGKYLTRAELLAGLGGPEAKARAEAREVEIAERAAKKKAREEKRERKAREKAALRASKVAAAAAAAAASASASAAPAPAPAPAPTTTTVAV